MEMFTNDRVQPIKASVISKFLSLSTSKSDFNEVDIVKRTDEIISNFIKYLKQNNLIAKDR